VSLRWSLASQQLRPMVLSTAPSVQTPPPVYHFMVTALAGVCCIAGWPEIFQQPVHHWRFLNSNLHAVRALSCFQQLRRTFGGLPFRFW
jgi:hypothetical protein